MNRDPLLRWKLLGVAATLMIAATPPLWLVRQGATESPHRDDGESAPRFVGRETCRECHEEIYQRWLGSDHDHAMEVADELSVLGDFNDAVYTEKGVTSRFFRKDGRFMVNTEGPDGKNDDFEIRYTFGVEPLQQYLIAFPGGRLQTLNVSWDTDEQRWFSQYPGQEVPAGDWLHWTRQGQNWNGMCAECHSTNLQKSYDPDSDTYRTTWSEIDVSCEACHGPASTHLAWARTEPMARPEVKNYGLVVNTRALEAKEQVELCAPCHARRSELGDYDHRQIALLDHQLPSLLEEDLYYADGQILDEVYVWGSFTQSKMYQSGIRCSDCHDVHSLKRHVQGNGLCLQCHRADAYDTKTHHFHKKTHEGKPSDGALCVKCHMPETPYMVIDDRADHSIRVPRPDLSRSIGTPNACSQMGCHDNKPLTWVVDAFTKWYGEAKKPHYATVLAAGRKEEPEAENELGRLAGDPLFPAIVRATALMLLGNYPSEESLTVFEKTLVDDEALVRYAALRYMPPARDPKRLVENAMPLLFDPLRGVRTQAAVLLADAPKELLKPYQQEALASGLREYEEAMAHSLDFSSSGYNLGNLFSRLGKNKEAESYYRRAISIDGLFFPAKVNLAVILNAEGRNQEAEKLLREVVEAYPEQHEAHYSLGLLLGELRRYKEAAEHLSIAAKGMPDHEGAKRNLRAIREYLSQVEAQAR